MKQLIILIALTLVASVGMAQTKQLYPDFELKHFDLSSQIDYTMDQFSLRVSDKNIVDMGFGGEFQTIGKVVEGKLVAIRPFKIKQDSCRHTFTVTDTKLKKTFTLRYNKAPIFLTGLKLQ